MGTRCSISLEGFNIAKVYKHWDGNPESTMKWLEDFNKSFTEARGDDNTYKFAQLLRSSINDAKKYNLDDSKYTGWGVVKPDEDCDEDFKYRLLKNGKVTVTKIR